MCDKRPIVLLAVTLFVGVINGMESSMLSLKKGESLSNLEPRFFSQAVQFLCKGPDNDDISAVQRALSSESEFKETIGPRLCTQLWNWDLFLPTAEGNHDSSTGIRILSNRYMNLLIDDICADNNTSLDAAFKLGQMYVAVRMRQMEGVGPTPAWMINNLLTTEERYDAFICGIIKQGNITHAESLAYKKLPEIFKARTACCF